MTHMQGNQVQRECAVDHPKSDVEFEMPWTETEVIAAAKK